MTSPPTILGLDPGTRFLGTAVLRGPELLDYGVHVLRNGDRADELLTHGKEVLFRIVRDYAPTIVAIEAPYLITTKRAAVLSTLAQVLHRRAADLGLRVLELTPESVRQEVTGNPHARKIEVATALARRLPQLQNLVPRPPKVPVLWLTARERYWLHMFDALALALACGSLRTKHPLQEGGFTSAVMGHADRLQGG